MWKYFSLSYLIIHNVNDIELIYPETSDEVFIAVSFKYISDTGDMLWHFVTRLHLLGQGASGQHMLGHLGLVTHGGSVD